MDTQGHWGLQHTRTHTHTENSARRKNRRSKIKWKGERKREQVSRAAESRQKGGGGLVERNVGPQAFLSGSGTLSLWLSMARTR